MELSAVNGIEENTYEMGDEKTFANFEPKVAPYVEQTIPKKSTNKMRLLVEIIMGIFIITLLIVVIALVIDMHMGTENGTQEMSADPGSCMELKQNGITTSGYYLIKPDKNFKEIEVYCDMETDGGGWTLVASIHENDILLKCEADDRWAAYATADQKVQTNWGNKRIFGNVNNCTVDDYKNLAYSSLNARDVMIWHVPPEPSNITLRERAKLRYRTTNHFLQNTGGNLKYLFEESYPLQINMAYQKRSGNDDKSSAVVDQLVKRADLMKSKIPDWFSYSNMYSTSYLQYGALYSSYGNNINLFSSGGSNYQRVSYGIATKFPYTETIVQSAKTQPFVLASVIDNNKDETDSFKIEVGSYYPRSERRTYEQNIITDGNYQLEYRANLYISSYAPNYCELHCVVYNEIDWSSVKPSSFIRSKTYSIGAEYTISGTPKNIVFVYVLLTRGVDKTITKQQIDAVAEVILGTFVTMPALFGLQIDAQDGLIAPVMFDKGNSSDVIETIPPMSRKMVEPGFVQFRAFNEKGYPNAMCPGVKMLKNVPEHVCVGGLSDNVGGDGTCGDFAGWAGETDDDIKKDEASGHAHSEKDIMTSLLLFYR